MKKFIERISEGLRKVKLFRSLRFRITILILLVGIVCCVVMRYGILSNYFLRAVEVRTSDVQSQMQILADHLISYNYLQDASSDVVNAEIEQVANLYDGRIMVIGRNFGVIKDTYGVATGKIIISEEVIKTFRGEFISHFDDSNHYIELTVPIKGTLDGKSETERGYFVEKLVPFYVLAFDSDPAGCFFLPAYRPSAVQPSFFGNFRGKEWLYR